MVQLSHPYMTTGKTIALTRWNFVDKVMSLLFNMLSRFIISFLPMSKRLLISWLQSLSAVILEPKKIVLSLFPLLPHQFALKWWDRMPWSSFTECWILSQFFHSPLSLPSKGSLVPLRILPLGWFHLHIWGYWYFSLQSWFQHVLHPARYFALCTLHIKLNKQGDNTQLWCTPFPIWNDSVVPTLVLTVASCPAYWFLSRQVRWSGIPISWRIFHSLLWSTQSKALV